MAGQFQHVLAASAMSKPCPHPDLWCVQVLKHWLPCSSLRSFFHLHMLLELVYHHAPVRWPQTYSAHVAHFAFF